MVPNLSEIRSDLGPWGRQAEAEARLVVLLGASNLVRGLPWIVDEIGARQHGAVELVVAGGHGRSYCVATSFLGRTLPPLLDDQVWSPLQELVGRCRRGATFVLTDVGNDLVYGLGVDDILGAVRRCLERLPGASRSLLVLPPGRTLGATPRWLFESLRRLFFPGHQLTFRQLHEGMDALVPGLERVAAAAGVATMTPRESWYGLDPIHLRRAVRADAWRAILDAAEGPAGRSGRCAGLGWLASLRVRVARAPSWRWVGLRLGSEQPCWSGEGGLRLWKL